MPYPMTDWWYDGFHTMFWFPFHLIGMLLIWLVFVVIAYLVYKDANERGMNGLLWGLSVLVPWIGIIFLILYLVLREERYRAAGRMTSEKILDERYAKGELTREQYMQMKDDIKKTE